MAFPATIRFSPLKFPGQFQLISPKSSQPTHFSKSLNFKHFRVNASTSVSSSNVSVANKPSTLKKNDYWQWKFSDKSIKIYYEEHEKEGSKPSKNMLMIPTISDVSTMEEWNLVVSEILEQDVDKNFGATLVDWPGLGNSDRPKLDYTADVMEKFLADLINSPGSPVFKPVLAAKKGLVKPAAIIAVAPTWAGPLPIVFGRDTNMESRYGLLRGTLRAPALGWMMYNVLVSNENAIQSQYKSHVYADPANVTPEIVQSRYALTKKEGARYVPAAFLTGLLDPVKSREEFLDTFASMEGNIPVLIVSTSGAPKRSKAEMEALRGAKGVTKFVEVPGALLPQEEYPKAVAEEIQKFLLEI
uniref:AB hydrolase-1 domain-containing protein n=1 Tax=Chenopodium quinoa TaxID=63459 RepID=A0A803M152_CHEQI